MHTYALMLKQFLGIVGDSDAARDDAYLCLTEGQRNVANGLDLPELQAIDENVAVAEGDDFVEVVNVDLDVFAILDGFNVTGGFEIYPEPGGMVGRNRYLDTTGKPAAGDITHYIRDGRNIYLRGTATENIVLRFRCRQQAPEISDANINDESILPFQHRLSAVFAAAEVYYNLHPRVEAVGEGLINFATKMREAKQIWNAEAKSSHSAEDMSRRETPRLRGYRAWPMRGRR